MIEEQINEEVVLVPPETIHIKIDEVVENSAIDTPDLYRILSEIQDTVTKKDEISNFKDEAISRMSKQIEKFEEDIIFKIKENLLKELITIYDSVERLEHKFRGIYEGAVGSEIENLKEEIESMLYRNDVELIPLSVSNEYNKDLQKVLKKEVVFDESSANTIEIMRQGFTYNEKIIRKQEVLLKIIT